MTRRLEEIFSALKPCKVFADIGCDHGYVAKAMLDGGKCQKAVVSDISAKCLEKARLLLSEYIDDGRAESVVSNGFENVTGCDQALIAGMGGEEIIGIIDRANELPETLVLQPMKNVDKVRLRAVKAGYRIEKDYCFIAEKKYYDLIILTRGEDTLSQEEIEFGRTNIIECPTAFLERNRTTAKKLNELLADEKISESDKAQIKIKLDRLKDYV